MENHHVESRDFEEAGYSLMEVLGSGSYGQVFKCVNVETGMVVAVKRPVNFTRVDQNERRFLQRVRERGDPDKVNIIRLLDVIVVRGIPSLVLEHLPYSLAVFLQRMGPQKISTVRCIGIQLLKAINFLKQCHIVHSDIKPGNIMVAGVQNDVLRVKLIDLGGFDVHEANPTIVTTRCYRAPEVVMGLPASFPMDVWTVSLVLLESFTGKVIFPAVNDRDLIAYFLKVFGPMPKELLEGRHVKRFFKEDSPGSFSKKITQRPKFPCPLGFGFDGLMEFADGESEAYRYDTAHFMDFLEEGLCLNPNTRITAEEALEMSFFTLEHFPFDDSVHEQEALRGVEALS